MNDHRFTPWTLLVVVMLVDLTPGVGLAQNSAPSSHMVFDDHFAGDILVHQVRVPKAGEAMHTYYEVLGWRGNAGGYAGIQAHPRGHIYICSIWDHESHTRPIRAVYTGAGTEVVNFGGEGTGLKSWNFKLGWETDTWYTFVARAWKVKSNVTHVGLWVQDQTKNSWTHLITMEVATEALFEGGTDSFLEDWLNTGKNRRVIHLRPGWKRRSDGDWFAFSKCRYSVNHWDLEPGKRSFHFRRNWDGGRATDRSGEYLYMISGGDDTRPTTRNPATFALAASQKEPDLGTPVIKSVQTKTSENARVQVAWQVDSHTPPPFAYALSLISGQQRIELVANTVDPAARSAEIDISPFANWSQERKMNAQLELRIEDVLDRPSEPVQAKVPVAAW